jgi:hypothetical protein
VHTLPKLDALGAPVDVLWGPEQVDVSSAQIVGRGVSWDGWLGVLGRAGLRGPPRAAKLGYSEGG